VDLLAVAYHEALFVPDAGSPWFDGLVVDDDPKILGVQQVGVDVPEDVLDRYLTAAEGFVVFGFEGRG
jgi:hypothetical protein